MWPPLDYYANWGFLNFFAMGLLNVFVLSRKPDLRLSRLYCIFTGEVAGWSLLYGLWLKSTTPATAEIFLRACMIPVVLLPTGFFHFVVELTRSKIPKWVLPANYLLGGIIGLLVFTPWFALGPPERHLVFPFRLRPGPIFPLHLAQCAGLVVPSHVLLFRTFQKSSGQLRAQILLVFFGMVIAFPSGMMNYLEWYRVPIPPLLTPLVSLIVVAMGIAIARHNLFNIEVLIRRTIIFSGLLLTFIAMIGIFCLWLPGRFLQLFHVRVPWLWLNLLSVTVVVSSFDWVRTNLVNATDWYLFQKRYDAKALLKQFTEEVLGIVDLQQLVTMTVATLTATMKLKGCDVWLRDENTHAYQLIASHGRPVPATQEMSAATPLVTYLRESPVSADLSHRMEHLPSTLRTQLEEMRGKLCLPLVLHDELIGLLTLGRKQSDEPFTQDDLGILLPLTRTLAIAITNAQLFTKLAKTQTQATLDALTGLLVRRAFLERAEILIMSAQPQQRACCLLMLDLDYFKQTNDTYGHLVGDAVLQEVALRLSGTLRQDDLLGRFGGEELIILLPNTSRSEALEIAERLRAVVGTTPIQTGTVLVTQTISIGLASCPEDGTALEELIARADESLYVAKRAGRNRVGTRQIPRMIPDVKPCANS